MPTSYKSALLVLATLIALLIIGLLAKPFYPNIDLVAYISGISTLAVAFLTVAYVVTTNNQLAVMNRQLDEMRKAREYQAQPLPMLHDVEVYLEKPRVFYTPPEARYSAQSRIFAKFRVKNEGSHPSINTVLSAWIGLPSTTKTKTFSCASCLIEVIAEGRSHPPTEGSYDDFMFTDDHEGELINAIRDKNLRKPPILKVRSIFRNALGACYSITSHYMLYMKDATDESTLTDWHSSIAAFHVKFKAELEQLPKIKKRNEEEWDRQFDVMKDTFASQFSGPEKLSLSCVAVPMTFSVELLSQDQYEHETKAVGFGRPIPSWFDGCTHDATVNG